MICVNCERFIHRQRDGSWYHDRNGSVKCRPGRDDQRARPVLNDPLLTPGDAAGGSAAPAGTCRDER